jgi:hypothetical protein
VVFGVYSRAIVAWTATPAKHTMLVPDALEMALRRCERLGHPIETRADPPQRRQQPVRAHMNVAVPT